MPGMDVVAAAYAMGAEPFKVLIGDFALHAAREFLFNPERPCQTDRAVVDGEERSAATAMLRHTIAQTTRLSDVVPPSFKFEDIHPPTRDTIRTQLLKLARSIHQKR
jgi:hypothetical protein